MVLTTPSSLASCAFTCVAFVSGVFFLARSAVRHVRFLQWPLLRRLHWFFLRTLIRPPRMRLSLLMRLLIVPMMRGFWPMRRLFRRIMVLCLFTPSGLMMMLVLQLFSLLVFCLSLLLSFWVFLLFFRCGPVFVSAMSPLVMPYTFLWFVRSMLFSRVTLLLMTFMHRVLLSGAQLDSLRSAGCRTCPCCQAVQANLEFHRVYEFLSRLRKEFEPRRAQLFARGRISLMEALSEIRAEETRLRGAGLLEVPSVLATRASSTPPAAPTHSRSSAPPLLPTPSGGSGRPRPHCDYCNNDGHIESQCYTKRKHLRKARSPSSGTSSSPSTASAIALTEQDILRLKRLLAALGSSSTGTAGSVTDASRTEHPLSTQSGTSPWVLDSGASFHMSSHSSTLSSLRSLDSPVHVFTADGTPLSVASRGHLSTPYSVPDVAHVPRLTMNLFSAGQLTDSGCHVILDVDSCSVQDRRTHTLVGAGPRRRDSQGLWELDWLHVPSAAITIASPSAAVASVTGSFKQWHHRLGHLCGSRLSSSVRRGLLGLSQEMSL
ncbi:uncharacterized protein [Aegilops tauschii subsp. strangulata]|uniref:uncharacterized protein isoform X1 n=1 Tax=Aegilops tauschii subsp. strangulata TaxID=200361 RepID=UPI003CC89CC1